MSQSSLICLGDIEGQFFVPGYQRGYRWNGQQVRNLLDDFWEFAEKGGNGIFFLQPLVARPREDKGRECFELIDGQQRLTTLYILEAVLRSLLGMGKSQLNFEISYETRKESKNFLQALAARPRETPEASTECLDFHFMAGACQAMLQWLAEGKRKNQASRLHGLLLSAVHFLWDPSSGQQSTSEERFTRLNSGRIALTDGELCRALLLMPQNHDVERELPPAIPGNAEVSSLIRSSLRTKVLEKRQILLGNDWDELEKLLRVESFWEFLGMEGQSAPATRMNLLLEIYLALMPATSRDYVCFNQLHQSLKRGNPDWRDAQSIWREIRQSMDILQYWYNDNDYYHWIGYLNALHGQSCLTELAQLARKMPEQEFRSEIKERIRKSIGKDAPVLDSYGYTPASRRLLFLFNVEYARRHSASCAKFPFGLHRNGKMSIEHVQARNVEKLRDSRDREYWLREHRKFLESPDFLHVKSPDDPEDAEAAFEEERSVLLDRAGKLLKKFEAAEKGKRQEDLGRDFEQLSGEILKFIEGRQEDSDSLYNLASLPGPLNSCLNNSVFAVKQIILRQILSSGDQYVPPATQALFMRQFTRDRCTAPWWTEEDRAGYRQTLLDTLSEFWPGIHESNGEGA